MTKKSAKKHAAAAEELPQLTMAEENERICVWLGWRRQGNSPFWFINEMECIPTPTFTDWEGAGVIIEQFIRANVAVTFDFFDAGSVFVELKDARDHGAEAKTGPLALRAATLRYIEEAKCRKQSK